MKELKESDLQVGDILIFENQDFDFALFLKYYNKSKESAAMYLLLYMIPWFDPGDNPENYKNIYHAAIWGNVNVNRGENKLVENLNRIVQAGTHGIDQAELDSTLKGAGVKNIYVYRFDKIDDDFENNINTQIRAFYNDTSIPYSYETAWLLAVICSMRYSDGELHKILNEENRSKMFLNYYSLLQSSLNERIALYREMDEMIMQYYPVVPLYYDQAVRFVQKNVHGFKMNPLNLLYLKRVYKTAP